MHGNESNATHAVFDLFTTLDKAPDLKAELFSKIKLDFIFMLNPDGSERWTRLNASDIDLNRDFHNEASKEIKLLKEAVAKKKYDYALNLHEQRTILLQTEFILLLFHFWPRRKMLNGLSRKTEKMYGCYSIGLWKAERTDPKPDRKIF